MSLAKDLLPLLVTVIHISLMGSNPVGPQSCEKKLNLQAEVTKQYLSSLLKDLIYAESVFIEHLFYNTTRETKTESLKPLDGITIPTGNFDDSGNFNNSGNFTWNSSLLNSMYEISECLTIYLPKVIGNLTRHEDVKTIILRYTRPFLVPFRQLAAGMKDCWKEGKLNVCPKNLTNNQTRYEMKEYALSVLHTAVKWTEGCIQKSE